MTKNPFLNAVVASSYIFAIGSFMSWGTKFAPKEDTFLAPIAMISLFTLSAAVMGYLFCYMPFMLYMDGKKKQAAELFLQTVGSFGLITLVLLLLLFTGR